MLDERKVKMMTRLALYEHTQGKEDFKISEYYRKDYAGIHMVCSIIWVTIGYICAVGLIVIAELDKLLANMSNMLLVTLAVTVLMGYVVLAVIYSIISNHIYNKKHREARFRVKKYNHNLIRLLKMYEKERN